MMKIFHICTRRRFSIMKLFASLIIGVTMLTMYNIYIRERILPLERSLPPERSLPELERSLLERDLEPCLLDTDSLIAKVVVSDYPRNLDVIEDMNPLMKNGHYSPTNCIRRQSVALIIPFRKREKHLGIFLHYIVPMLQKQNMEFGIYVVEQKDSHPFNRGALMNVGYLESLKFYNYTCFIFHDVDLIPENQNLIYTCDEASPKHMSVAIQTHNYTLPYSKLIGGVLAVTKDQFTKVNGFSNMYFGWGGEDDDLYDRITHHGYNITRPDEHIARYHMIRHTKNTDVAKNRYILLKHDTSRMNEDGLSSMKYKKSKVTIMKLYIKIGVKLDKEQMTAVGNPDKLLKTYTNMS